MRRDVVIVGGGIVGSACAYFLAREGVRVTLLEREHVAFGASGRNPGFVWLHTRNPGFALDVALASRRLYPELAEELAVPFELRAGGGLVFFLTPEQGRVMEEFVAARQADGLPMELLEAADVRRLVPPIRPDVLGATYCSLDAHINTARFVEALAGGARAHGAEIREGAAVEEVVLAGGQAVGVRTREGLVAADVVVVAAGVWAPRLLEPLGISLPVGAERLQVVATAPVPDRIEPLVYGPLAAKQYELFRRLPSYADRHFTASYEEGGVELLELLAQRLDGTVLLGCPMDYPEELDLSTTLEGIGVTLRAIAEDFPGLRRVPIERSWAGLLPYTADTLPVVDEVLPGLLVAAGHVYGNSAGPMTGKLVAALVLGEEPEIDLSECRLERGLAAVAGGEPTRW